jgi:hypothetical protein
LKGENKGIVGHKNKFLDLILLRSCVEKKMGTFDLVALAQAKCRLKCLYNADFSNLN